MAIIGVHVSRSFGFIKIPVTSDIVPPSNPNGKQFRGTIVWRTQNISASGTDKPDLTARADVEIPERKLKMTMLFRRSIVGSQQTQATELRFVLPPDFDGGTISEVTGILMKPNERDTGTPLTGLAVKITDGSFFVGMSGKNTDRIQNARLLAQTARQVPVVGWELFDELVQWRRNRARTCSQTANMQAGMSDDGR